MSDTGPNVQGATVLRDAPPKTLARSSSAWGHTLPEGTRLGEFEITGLVGEGGFGIVYVAYDHSLQRRVAIKEYMPSSIAARTSGAATVSVKYEHNAGMFDAGLQSFVNEARMLARFDHPALVKVHRFWEANGTAYMAMPFYEGPTLRAALAAMNAPPDEVWLRQLMEPLLDAVDLLHSNSCFHRDIAPDNILLTERGPLLLDFGAARRVIGAATQALTVILKPGYAPVEQYGELANMAQGAWTDIYALACVMYNVVTGKTPPASIERLLSDRLEPASTVAAGRYDASLLGAIDAGLAVKPQARPQTIAEFRAMLGTPRTIQRTPAHTAIDPKVPAAPMQRRSTPATKRSYFVIAALVSVSVIVASAVWYRHQSTSGHDTVNVEARVKGEAQIAPVSQPPRAAPSVPKPTALPAAAVVSPAVVTESPHVAIKDEAPAAQISAAREVDPPSKNTPQSEPVKAKIPKRPANNCSDLLTKASLQELSPEESQYIQHECR